ncbi:prepilin-type N-terminal cleavage/methylation domain-containing protein [Janthinobacterium sp. SUN211]|jgi:general secretion pathway protein G|uniref:type II secretion system protein n=1 Tax=Janthinobacterium sp. SUN211 TaxID=3014786 RepID=UPI0027142A5C|nr:prepilin-type N-terminal cleavage/methylation domain-containing protein [Janthinobacterium sp. SUN211]MDO8051437.1 prepilin-type N-terminal cleavage/methylation domain-containing protein [Janthinobacterium sp. SUN211]
MRSGERGQRGFTLIELLVTLAILGLLVSVAAPRYFGNLDRAKEDVLREDLYVMRDAIDKFYSDHNRYPDDLVELVTARYLRKLPVDPFTQSAKTWVPVAPDDAAQGVVADVHSGASNAARDGSWLREW